MTSDTIAAIATPSGTGGIGIVRLSGPVAHSIGAKITGVNLSPRHARFVSFKDTNKETIDTGIAIYFEGPASFTGEDIVELQAHGGSVVLDLLLNEALSAGARMARPGEFSERAFINDKIDLAQAEAIADIIESHSEAALRSTMRTFRGMFSKRVNDLANDITKLRMYVEAAIDFPEEEIDFVTDGVISESLEKLLSSTQDLLQESKSGAVLTRGLNTIILGKPNAGKSSLLNALAADDIAIVTDQPGTTRDLVRQQIQLGGIMLNVIDTAGLRQSNDRIEQEGIKKIRSIAESADVVLYLRDASSEGVHFCKKSLDELIQAHNLSINSASLLIVINNKIDLVAKDASIVFEDKTPNIFLSAKEGQGINLIAKVIKDHYKLSNTSENSFSARRRHIKQIEISLASLEKGKQQLEQQQAGELLAEDLRQAQDSLGEITGKVSSDDLLGEIFSSFCIGK